MRLLRRDVGVVHRLRDGCSPSRIRSSVSLVGSLGDPPLENTANNLSPDPGSVDRRRLRFGRREVLWSVSSLQRVRHCGRVPRSNAEGVTLRLREGVAGYSGLQHCGSVWADPVCAGRILLHRALEIGAVLGRAVQAGHSLGFVTLTMRHHDAQSLELLWGAAAKGWQRSISGKGWVSVSGLVEGWVRVWEVTHGRNGWHVHVHCVVVLAKGARQEHLDRVGQGMFDRWSRGIVGAGLDAPRLVGQDWHLVGGEDASSALGEYLAKMVEAPEAQAASLGLELTHTMAGRSASSLKTRPTWALLDDLVHFGEKSSLDRWREWERVSRGKRQVGWSKGLREQFAPDIEELTDADVVEQEIGSAHDDIVRWGAQQWRELVAVPGRLVELLEAAEQVGPRLVRVLLDEWAVPYSVV